MSESQKPTIEQVKEKHESKLMGIPGVQGIGIGERLSKPFIRVYVDKKTKSLETKIPKQIEGYPVEIEESGEFKTLPA